MLGMEFGPAPKAGIAAKVATECRKLGLMVLTTGVYETMRFIPPLTVSEAEVDQALAIVGEAVATAEKEL